MSLVYSSAYFFRSESQHFIISRAASTDGHCIVDRLFLISFQDSTAAKHVCEVRR